MSPPHRRPPSVKAAPGWVRASPLEILLTHCRAQPCQNWEPWRHPHRLPMSRRRIRACSIPSTVHAPRQTDPDFLPLIRAVLLDLKKDELEQTLEASRRIIYCRSVGPADCPLRAGPAPLQPRHPVPPPLPGCPTPGAGCPGCGGWWRFLVESGARKCFPSPTPTDAARRFPAPNPGRPGPRHSGRCQSRLPRQVPPRQLNGSFRWSHRGGPWPQRRPGSEVFLVSRGGIAPFADVAVLGDACRFLPQSCLIDIHPRSPAGGWRIRSRPKGPCPPLDAPPALAVGGCGADSMGGRPAATTHLGGASQGLRPGPCRAADLLICGPCCPGPGHLVINH